MKYLKILDGLFFGIGLILTIIIQFKSDAMKHSPLWIVATSSIILWIIIESIVFYKEKNRKSLLINIMFGIILIGMLISPILK